jgi:hypothetical protein
MDEAQRAAGGQVVYLAGDFDVRTAGELQMRLTTGGPITIWLDDNSIDDPRASFAVEPGRHRITLRIDVRQWPSLVRPAMELVRPQGSKCEFQVVDGA